MTVPTIAAGAVRKLLDGAEQAGLDVPAILEEVGLTRAAVDDPDGRVPIATLHAAWDAVLARAPMLAGAAVLAAERYAPGDYGLVGFVAMNSATLGEALAQTVRYVGLWTDDPTMSLDDQGTLHLDHRAGLPDCAGKRVAMEAAPAEVLHGARVLTQRRITPIEVRFFHPAPTDTSPHEAFFGCPVRFGQKDSAMVLRAEDLALPLPKADAQLGAFLRQMAGEALAKRRGPESPLDRVREAIADELRTGEPKLELVAQRLAMSERSLRRRLEEAGTSFRALLDETRAELARTWVADRRVPLSEVAFLLGFSEPSAFHRAFKRWTGATPAAWRARA